MRARTNFIIFILLILLTSCITPSNSSNKLKVNPDIKSGVLDNGLSYYIQNNKKPENRIELRLVVNVGSIQEDENQKGLAHFVEHMAFNGTKNFPKDRLIKYLESLGMGFGPEINAYTSFDETVYKLSIPADDPEILKNAFLILKDWASEISLDDDEIEKERGVIVEEWRGGRGVNGRYRDVLFPTLLKGSKYAERLPIGDVEIVKNCSPDLLREYYKKWYRPDLISLVVVGDIDVENIKNIVTTEFNYKSDQEIIDRGDFRVPIEERIDVELILDPEVTTSSVNLFIKEESITVDNKESYRTYINQFLSTIMFNGRMEEIYKKPDSPFLNAQAGFVNLIRSTGILNFSTAVVEGQTLSGFKALLVEIEKVKQNGFTEIELKRAKSQVEMIMNQVYNERDNKRSTSVASELVSYILRGDIPMNIEDEVVLLGRIINEISLNETNKTFIKSLNATDRTITVHTPDTKSNKLIDIDKFRDIFATVSSFKYTQREETIINRPLFDREIKAGEVVSETTDKLTGITTLVLSNGATVVLKPTDFKADEIMFSAISFGGLSLVSDNEFRSGELSASLAITSGLNGFDSTQLDRVLTGKNVTLKPWINNYTEGFTGSSNISNKETLFQLLNLYYTEPEFRKESFDVLIKNIESSVVNRENSPKAIFYDRVSELLAKGHFRSKPVTLKTLKEVKFDQVKRIYSERFKNPSDFYFVFTGSFKKDELTPLIKKYIGSIPSEDVKEEAKDLGLKFPEGVVEDIVIKGIEDQSVVEIIFNGEFSGIKKDEFGLNMLANYLEEGLRVKIREELSGTYGVSVFSNIRQYPAKKYAFGIYFGCEPGREDELIEAVFKKIKELKSGVVDKDVVASNINNFTRGMELNLKNNNYWHNSITNKLILGREFKDIVDVDTTDITPEYFVELANRYIDEERFVKVILKPESKK